MGHLRACRAMEVVTESGAGVDSFYAMVLVGTALVLLLPGDTAWPLVAFCAVMPLLTLALLARLREGGS